MAIENIALRKLIRMMYASEGLRRRLLRIDIRDDRDREGGVSREGGGDFYGPFWRDAKDHALGLTDLHVATTGRLNANPGRQNLYPQLRDGFLVWWNQRRRWTNEPFRPFVAPKGRAEIEGLNSSVKVDNFMAVLDAGEQPHLVYPYFSPDPVLNGEAARICFRIIARACPSIDINAVRVLDVIRGESFSLERAPLQGNEDEIFRARYTRLIAERDILRDE